MKNLYSIDWQDNASTLIKNNLKDGEHFTLIEEIYDEQEEWLKGDKVEPFLGDVEYIVPQVNYFLFTVRNAGKDCMWKNGESPRLRLPGEDKGGSGSWIGPIAEQPKEIASLEKTLELLKNGQLFYVCNYKNGKLREDRHIEEDLYCLIEE